MQQAATGPSAAAAAIPYSPPSRTLDAITTTAAPPSVTQSAPATAHCPTRDSAYVAASARRAPAAAHKPAVAASEPGETDAACASGQSTARATAPAAPAPNAQ